jgi:hypothetical protein
LVKTHTRKSQDLHGGLSKRMISPHVQRMEPLSFSSSILTAFTPGAATALEATALEATALEARPALYLEIRRFSRRVPGLELASRGWAAHAQSADAFHTGMLQLSSRYAASRLLRNLIAARLASNTVYIFATSFFHDASDESLLRISFARVLVRVVRGWWCSVES